ncbi:hypothetical protein EVAR_33023_1 [Eumeta japonica]|uniref:Uncharacterized protein n=1 Tax=Eumeta variegata TaxID=151549 RepID=A0A4C1VU00_EUMVA|nr:hypothetical protein EVAR_33023_1 [Eumeta japonica]
MCKSNWCGPALVILNNVSYVLYNARNSAAVKLDTRVLNDIKYERGGGGGWVGERSTCELHHSQTIPSGRVSFRVLQGAIVIDVTVLTTQQQHRKKKEKDNKTSSTAAALPHNRQYLTMI